VSGYAQLLDEDGALGCDDGSTNDCVRNDCAIARLCDCEDHRLNFLKVVTNEHLLEDFDYDADKASF
jgi:hypothetical protein